jgi:acyl-CoA thioesterase FadM
VSRFGEHVVGRDDVDASGHLNVARYAEIAEHTGCAVFADLVAPPAAMRPLVITIVNRQHREQFEGARLAIDTAVLAAAPEAIEFHVELRNLDDGVLASAHRVGVGLRDAVTGRAEPVGASPLAAAMTSIVDQPEHGRPRRLGDDLLGDVDVARLAAGRLEVWCDRVVDVAECDAHGWYAGGPARLAWGPVGTPRADTQWQFRSREGHALALANVENRRRVLAVPRQGAHLRTVAANIAVERNRRVRREWAFDVDTQAMIVAGEFVDLLVDLDQRRSVDIPESVRAELTRYLRPELGPDRH